MKLEVNFLGFLACFTMLCILLVHGAPTTSGTTSSTTSSSTTTSLPLDEGDRPSHHVSDANDARVSQYYSYLRKSRGKSGIYLIFLLLWV